MLKQGFLKLCALGLSLSLLSACTSKPELSDLGKEAVKLNPDTPISITVWHYYNGSQQAAFDSLVDLFNTTRGKDLGIFVEGYSKGSVRDLEDAVASAVNSDLGAEKVPDIFSAYSSTAIMAQEKGKLVNLRDYFSEDYLSAYIPSYIKEGEITGDGSLYLFPVAKSTEILMVNKTEWDTFAADTGAKKEDLGSVQGVTSLAERYYRWSDAKTPEIPDDGKAFFGRDSMANYFILGLKQMGADLFTAEGKKGILDLDKDKIRIIWDNYYVPMMHGWFNAIGRFRSDDVKTGDLMSFVGSSTSSMYFPEQVEDGDKVTNIDYMILPPPVFDGGQDIRVQQGAGMAVTKSSPEREYASCEFLSWLTQPENNLRFVCESAYMPVRKDANNLEVLDTVVEDYGISINPRAYGSLEVTLRDFQSTSFYVPPCFNGADAARKVLDDSLPAKISADKALLAEAMETGLSREEALKDFLTEENYEAWYQDFCSEIRMAVDGET